MNGQSWSILLAVKNMGPLTPSQLSRFLFDSGLVPAFDLLPALSPLKEEGLLKQGMSLTGITYFLTPEGEEALAAQAVPVETLNRFTEISIEYCAVFAKEKEYIAQYTEQANGIFPLFLSIRKKEKILMQVNILVQDEATAKAVTRNWMENAHKTYDAVWESISDGLGLSKPRF
jgi:DNA-binding PadR family transcriptional regulator